MPRIFFLSEYVKTILYFRDLKNANTERLFPYY